MEKEEKKRKLTARGNVAINEGNVNITVWRATDAMPLGWGWKWDKEEEINQGEREWRKEWRWQKVRKEKGNNTEHNWWLVIVEIFIG